MSNFRYIFPNITVKTSSKIVYNLKKQSLKKKKKKKKVVEINL